MKCLFKCKSFSFTFNSYLLYGKGYLCNAHISSESRPPLIIITSLHLKYVSVLYLSCVCITMVISYQYTQVFMCYNSEKLYRYQRRSEVSSPIRFITVHTVFKTGSEAVLIISANHVSFI